ncbi:unnamed protein product [Rotaria magnacalcarata]|uniref:Ankyrin repeat protein n=1 Tax=Rotaria magnacalcarata TaxID=392030 RepID=A0A816UNA6_9BILA|nr:unnamed protein product [Rotaria magnacalcarata]CAF4050587.1 unnamed protein product [Rotaria magnacalcarata]
MYSDELLQQLNALLHQDSDLATLDHPKKGSYFHILIRNSQQGQEKIAFRMIYALSNAGADPNVTNDKGNTPLHEAIIRHCTDTELDLIQALFRVGVDPRIVNYQGKTADAYINDNNPQLTALYRGYNEGIWAAVETGNSQEIERLIKGFIKVDCKHNSNKSLLDKACDLNCPPITHLLADYQVTNELLHSILACDWDRASIIYQHENKFLKSNAFDSIHRLTCIRTCSKSLLEYCLDTQSSKSLDILFNSSTININVNILCTDGLPFFFHCFNEIISNDVRKIILSKSNMYTKSSKGETFLFHLINLYSKNENEKYLNVFKAILYHHPLLLAQRNHQEQTIIEYIAFTTSTLTYNRLRTFYNPILNVLMLQLKRRFIIEEFILNQFGYYLLIFFRNKKLPMKTQVYDLLYSLQSDKGLPAVISDLKQAVTDDNFVKLKQISKIKPNAFYANDSFGRRCIHLAVLYQRYDILKFICDNYNDIINTGDNLNRTCYHYACIMNDKKSIEILEQYNAQQIIDCMNLNPMDYLMHRELCSEEFHAHDFLKSELEKESSAISNHLKLAFYSSLKKAIESNSVEDIKSINNKIIEMGFHIKYLNPNSSLNDYIQGQRYIPLLFLAVEHRSIASIKCLLELGIPLTGQLDTIGEYSGLKSFQAQSEELQRTDIMDIINNLEDTDELKGIFKQHLLPIETISNENFIKADQEKDLTLEKTTQGRNIILKHLSRRTERNENEKSKTCILF